MRMDVLQAIVLGIVQGLTEFAPVSSSAHLVVVPWLFGWSEPSLTFDTVLHLGTLAAVLAVFWRDIWLVVGDWLRSLKPGGTSTPYSRLGWLLIVGTIPGALLGYLLKQKFEELFSKPLIVGLLLVGTAAFLVIGEQIGKRQKSAEQLSFLNTIWIGLSQAAAIAPGISRSGATMSMGLVLGLDRAEAARFSFLLSVPIILGAAASQLKDIVKAGGSHSMEASLAIGFLAAAISGYLCINFLLGFVRRRSFYAFSGYCLVLGIVVVGLGLAGLR